MQRIGDVDEMQTASVAGDDGNVGGQIRCHVGRVAGQIEFALQDRPAKLGQVDNRQTIRTRGNEARDGQWRLGTTCNHDFLGLALQRETGC